MNAHLQTADTITGPDPPVAAFKSASRVSPLSYQQETYWAAERQGTVGYRRFTSKEHSANAFGAFRVEGPLDVSVLQRSFDEVLRRHDALRMRFETRYGAPLQIVTDADSVSIEHADARKVSSADPARAAADLASSAALVRFSYRAGVLLRAHVIRVSETETIVVVVVPHIIADSVSVQVLLDECLTLYAHFLHGRPSPLPEPEVQYADYVRWQRAWVRGEASQRIYEELRNRLAGIRPLRLPAADTATADSSADAAETRFALDARTLVAVQAISAAQRVTPFVVMLSAFTTLLSRWSAETDILLLAPFAARPDASTRKVVGMFSNLCPLRCDLSGQPRFDVVVEQMQEVVLRALRHRCAPHAVVAQALGERGDISCTGVGVNAVPEGGKVMPRGCAALLGHLRISPYVVDTGRLAVRQMRGDLSFWVAFSAEGGIAGRLMYRRASFGERTIERRTAWFADAMARLIAQPRRSVSDMHPNA